jgi:hypothetical protein
MINSVDELVSKKSSENLVVVPTFNNPTYTLNTVNFFSNRGFDIVILDNNSSYTIMLDLLNTLSKDFIVFSDGNNNGPRYFYENKSIYQWLPNNFIATDPDLEFNEKLLNENILKLIDISEQYQLFKVGSALRMDIKENNFLDVPILVGGRKLTIREIELEYFKNVIGVTENNIIYSAPIDTTFAMYNKKYDQGFMSRCARIDGIYAVHHYGWFTNNRMTIEEAEYYSNACVDKQFSAIETVKRGHNYQY